MDRCGNGFCASRRSQEKVGGVFPPAFSLEAQAADNPELTAL
jgi:hypothetical protein